MPHVAARTTSTIPAESGLQRDSGLGALTSRTKGARIWRGRMTIFPLMHSGVSELLFAISTAPVGASHSAAIPRTCTAIERLLLVRAQRPVARACPTMPAARHSTVPDAHCNYNGAGRMAEDAPARNGRPHHHLSNGSCPGAAARAQLAREQKTRLWRAHTSHRERRTAQRTLRSERMLVIHRKEQTKTPQRSESD